MPGDKRTDAARGRPARDTAARNRLARDAAARAEAAGRRRRQRGAMLGAGLLVVVLGVVGVVWLTQSTGSSHPIASASTSSTPTPAACSWSVVPSNARATEMRDVGTPPATGEPRTGTATMTITTNRGTIKVQIDRAKVPCAAASFTYLASEKFFDNTPCHRLVDNALHALHCGDPAGDGWGGPAYRYADENVPVNRRPAYPKGTVALANGGVNTNQSQFYIIDADSDVSAQAPVLGQVTQGIEIVEEVAKAGNDGAFEKNADGSPGPGGGHPKLGVTIQSLTIT
jgi:peptidyl-prolyl cis-trans isomerase B (cyclophilin B)